MDSSSVKPQSSILFLIWESPWPAQSGGSLRTLGLLKQLSSSFKVEVVVFSAQPLSTEQTKWLSNYAVSISRVPMIGTSVRDRLRVISTMARYRCPYHCAVIESSIVRYPQIRRFIEEYQGIVFTSVGHFGTLTRGKPSPNWILNQCDADVEFWRVYARQEPNLIVKMAAALNHRMAAAYFSNIYSKVGAIVSVCEADRQLTKALAPDTPIHVVENGVDCSFFMPQRSTRTGPPRLLFTGTSVRRNMIALRRFVKSVFPLIQHELPNIELLIAGSFSDAAKSEFADNKAVCFTGRVDDMRPFFNRSDVFVSPFEETHGSKLKVAEAMAMGMPIVSTPAGIRGFQLIQGESVLIARSNEEFARHVVALLRNPSLREALGTAARQSALSLIDWDVLGKRLVSIVGRLQAKE